MAMRLNVLESAKLDEEVVLANRIKISRTYVTCSVDREKYTQHTIIFDQTVQEGDYRG